MKIEELCNWSDAKRVETKLGPKMLRVAVPGNLFWDAWKASKDVLKNAGVSCGKNRDGLWEACWWLPLDSTVQAEMDAKLSASRATDADISIPSPEGLAYLPFQKAGIAYAIGHQNVLIADEMGLGKTIQAIGVWNSDSSLKSCLIVCPASLRINWRKEFGKWSVRPISIGVVNGGKPSDWLDAEVVVINYDVLGKHRARIDARSWDLLIVDEAHYAKNPDSQRTRALFGHVTKDGKVKIAPISAKKSILLTGTPILNRPIELWPIVRSLDPVGLGKSFWGFAKRYCDARDNGYGWEFKGALRTDELQRLMRERFMVRRLKTDVLTELPPKRHQTIELPANGAAGAVAAERQAYESHQAYFAELEARFNELVREGLSDCDEGAEIRREISRRNRVAFEEMAKARHAVALAKVPKVIEHLENCLESGPVICFAHHRDVVDQIMEAFGDRAVKVDGSTPMEARDAAVVAFQEGKVDLFVGNIKAAGVGLTLTRSSHVVFAELSWVPADLSQASDRAHRIGQQASVLVQYLVLEDSVDSILVESLIAKQDVIERVLDRQPAGVLTSPSGISDVEVRAVSQQPTEVEIDFVPEKPVAPAVKLAVHSALRILAGMCDGAFQLDGIGFNKLDSNFGKSLAAAAELTDSQARIGAKLVRKYHRQLPSSLLENIS